MGTKVRVSDITPDGRTISGTLMLERLNKRMEEGANNEIRFLEAPLFEIRVFGTPQGAEVRGRVTARYRQPCSRCLKEIDQELERELRYVLKPLSSVPEGVDPEQDAFAIYYEGEYIDFEDALQETLILGLSPFLLPERLPDGTCSLCALKVQDAFSFGPQESAGKARLGALLEQARQQKKH